MTKLFLIQFLVDNCSYVTQCICKDMDIALVECKKFEKKNPNKNVKIEIMRLIEK